MRSRSSNIAYLRLLVTSVFCGITISAAAQVPGTCSRPNAEAQLDIANVRARIPNTGSLFWRSAPSLYEVPKGSGLNSIFSSGVWIGGMVDGDLRVAATRYGPYEFWAGPINDDGTAPADCSLFDHVWKVNASDVTAFDRDGVLTQDLQSWPTGLGAPTLSPVNSDGSATASDGVDNDNDGLVDEAGEMRSITNDVLALPLASRVNRVVNLAAGERPEIQGDQMLWFIMNDVGNTHNAAQTDPMGLEVHVSAFAFDRPGDIGNTTFYRYKLFYKGPSRLEDAYFGLFVDTDLGNAFDDYVGSDSTLGMGITYNADNDDEGSTGYGNAPPALGYDILQGPVVASAGDTAVVSGTARPNYRRLQMTTFAFYWSWGGPYGDPSIAADYYNFMQGRWKDGSVMTYGDNGYTQGNPPSTFMYPGDVLEKEYWTEFDTDGMGTPNAPSDRRWYMSTGPFDVSSNLIQDIVFAVVWARGNDNFDSYRRLKVADRRVQNFFDSGFGEATPPDAPVVSVGAVDHGAILSWTNPDDSNNFVDGYRAFNPTGDPDNPFSDFEGYEVWQFDQADDTWPSCHVVARCQMVRAFDVINGVTRIEYDENEDWLDEVVADGTDSGIRHTMMIDGLVNYQSYHFGVRAYALNRESVPPVSRSEFTRVSVVPGSSGDILSDSALAAAADADSADIVADHYGIGSGTFSVNIVDPTAVRACSYRVEFYLNQAGLMSNDIYCGDERVIDGSNHLSRVGENLGVFDGLEYSIFEAPVAIGDFSVVSNGNGPLDPPDMAAFAFDGLGFPEFNGLDRPTVGYQQASSDATWGISVGGGAGPTYDSFISRSLRGNNLDFVGRYDYEMRFTSEGGKARRDFDDGSVIDVPFELWRTGINTPDDRSDDVRMIPIVCEEGCGAGTNSMTFDIGGNRGIPGGNDDPLSDWVYWYIPMDNSPGKAGYDMHFASAEGEYRGNEVFGRTVLVLLNGGESPYTAALPEEGTIFRITTEKPIQPGDTFTFSTVGYEPMPRSAEEQVLALGNIGIVPNPYKAASFYETSSALDEVRFTNLPPEATIRVFTLNGTLIRTLQKNSPASWLAWDLKNEHGRSIASGMYVIHIDVPDVGSTVLKFSMATKGRR